MPVEEVYIQTLKESIEYIIDYKDIILQIDGPWSTYAEENRADLPIYDLVGKWIFDFIDSKEVRIVYKLLFDAVRCNHQQLEIPYRCDSPDLIRFMTMVIEPAP